MTEEKKRIYLSPPEMGEKERQYLLEAFDSNWIAPLGPFVDRFEQALAETCQVPHVAALASGTAALHLALVLCGVGPGDEVICQSLTFVASANPIRYVGAEPVFVDSEEETWNMSPAYLREAVVDRLSKGKTVKAIIVVHLYGMPAKMDEILAIANEFDIPVIEDAAEALGSTYKGRLCGSMGKFGILSFNGNKIITTGGGGALLGHDAELIDRARWLAAQAKDPAPHYEHSVQGYNYRLSNLSAAIGLGQLEGLAGKVERRRAVFESYKAALSGVPGLRFVEEPAGSESNRWLTTVLVDKEMLGVGPAELVALFEQETIEVRRVWKPMHLQKLFQCEKYFGADVSCDLFMNAICLPSSCSENNKSVSIFKDSFSSGHKPGID